MDWLGWYPNKSLTLNRYGREQLTKVRIIREDWDTQTVYKEGPESRAFGTQTGTPRDRP